MINTYKGAGTSVVHSISVLHDSCPWQGCSTVMYTGTLPQVSQPLCCCGEDGLSGPCVCTELPRYRGFCFQANKTQVLTFWLLRAKGQGSSPPGMKDKALMIHRTDIFLN